MEPGTGSCRHGRRQETKAPQLGRVNDQWHHDEHHALGVGTPGRSRGMRQLRWRARESLAPYAIPPKPFHQTAMLPLCWHSCLSV